jgi:ribosome biogenesis ATPase
MEVKLQHLINKILDSPDLIQQLSSNTSNQQGITSKQVLDILLSKHREYRRKNNDSLLLNIESILSDVYKRKKVSDSTNQITQVDSTSSLEQLDNPTTGSEQLIRSNSASSLKRKRIDHHTSTLPSSSEILSLEKGDEKEDNYDQQAKQHDFIQANSPSTMLLNATLQQRYKGMSLQQQKEQKATLDDRNLQSETLTARSTNQTQDLNKSHTISSTTKKKRNKSKSNYNNGSSQDNDLFSETPNSVYTPCNRPSERYSDLGGMDNILMQIRQLIEYPLAHPELFSHLGITPPRGVLLRGPPGCGKTHLANAIAGQLNVTYFKISAPEIVSGMSGESESRLRQLFAAASASAPSIIFMDEIDAIAPKRSGDSSSKGMEKRIVAQLLTCMDSLSPENNQNGAPVMVLGATNRPDSIDSALRRAGRFDREIILGVPDEIGRLGILKVMTQTMRLSGDMNLKILAKKTPGFVGADIKSLTKEAGVIAINRIFKKVLIHGESVLDSDDNIEDAAEEKGVDHDGGTTLEASVHSEAKDIHSVVRLTPEQLDPLYVTMSDFLAAIPHVQPSSKREGFATIPDVSWDNIGALQSIREELSLSVLEPISHPEKFEALGLPLPAGVLLYGPPGCGKTLLAKAIANESGANFISVKGPELLDKYVGESERAVRQVFERARSSSPCIVFFDELDSLCPKRGSDSSGGGVSERVVNQLLTEMDGLDSRRSVFVIAATNRPELIDPAMLRPGRLDKLLYVPLPTPEDRVSILKALAKKVKLAADVDLEVIARSSKADGYSGADCSALLREAGLAVLRDDVLIERGFQRHDTMDHQGAEHVSKVPAMLEISQLHFDYAFQHVMPSVSKKDQAKYDRMRNRMARARTRGGVGDEVHESSTTESVLGDGAVDSVES